MQPAWMAEAWREFGQREVSGAAANPHIQAIFKDAGHPKIKSDEVAWCAAFVSACLKRAGWDHTNSLMARSYLSWGTEARRKRPGTIAVFSRGSNPAHGHVGFWVGEDDEHVFVLGGNQSDSVNVTAIKTSRLLGLRWPSALAGESEGDLFRLALEHVFKMEGGYTEDPHDPGGPTNLGITLATYAKHRGSAVTAENLARLRDELKAISKTEAAAIYKKYYWMPSAANDLPRPVALMHFDTAVNMGVGTAARMLQKSAGAEVDGIIGPHTRARVWKIARAVLLQRYAEERRNRYRALSHFWRFGRGWLSRVDKTLARSLELVPPSFASAPNPTNTGEQAMKFPSRDTLENSSPESKWWGQSLTIWGSFITGLSTVLPVVAPLFGLNLTGELVVNLGEDLVRVGQALGGLMGTLMVITGRIRASQKLTTRQVTLRL